jgi:preprotein translocase subunit YajC
MMYFVAEGTPPAVPAPDGGFDQTLLMIGIAIVFFYFILWRPESKRRKQMEEKRQALKKGDRVIVAGGIVGEVFKVQADTIILRLADGAKMEVLKGAIQDVQSGTEAAEKTEMPTTPPQA